MWSRSWRIQGECRMELAGICYRSDRCKLSQDEFIGLQGCQEKSCTPSGSGYTFIELFHHGITSFAGQTNVTHRGQISTAMGGYETNFACSSASTQSINIQIAPPSLLPEGSAPRPQESFRFMYCSYADQGATLRKTLKVKSEVLVWQQA